MGLTSGIEALRRRLTVCLVLLVGIGLAGLAMANPKAEGTLASATRGPQAAPTTSSTAAPPATVESPPSTPPTTPFITPAVGAAVPTPPPSAGRPTTTTTPPPVVPITPAAPATCGAPIPKAGGGTWHCTFDDEFNGTSVDQSKWRIQETSWNGFHSGPECFMNRPANVSVSDGVLRLTARKEANGFMCQAPDKPYGTQFTSGMLTTYGKFTQAFGRFEIRAKIPPAKVKGLQTSFWLWPQDPFRYGLYPSSGEIDMAEEYSLHPDRVHPLHPLRHPRRPDHQQLLPGPQRRGLAHLHVGVDPRRDQDPVRRRALPRGPLEPALPDAAPAALRPAVHALAHAGPGHRPQRLR